MTLDEIKNRVADIAAMAGDAEAAHSAEDGLYLALLESIADGECSDPQACAAEAVKTQAINFGRWCV